MTDGMAGRRRCRQRRSQGRWREPPADAGRATAVDTEDTGDQDVDAKNGDARSRQWDEVEAAVTRNVTASNVVTRSTASERLLQHKECYS